MSFTVGGCEWQPPASIPEDSDTRSWPNPFQDYTTQQQWQQEAICQVQVSLVSSRNTNILLLIERKMSCADDDGSSGWQGGPANAFKHDIFQFMAEEKSRGRQKGGDWTTLLRSDSVSQASLVLTFWTCFRSTLPHNIAVWQRNGLRIRNDLCQQWERRANSCLRIHHAASLREREAFCSFVSGKE